MTTQEELKEIYHTVSKMDIMELKKRMSWLKHKKNLSFIRNYLLINCNKSKN